MVSAFNFRDFRKFIEARFREMPKEGYGQSRRLAEFLQVHTTLVSQVFKGLKSFTPEQAALVAEFLELSDRETEYFLLLVQLERAGNEALRRIYFKQLEELKKESQQLVNRVGAKRTLSENERAVFYSDWIYTAVRQLTAIPEFQTRAAIAKKLNLSQRRLAPVFDFLLEAGLCTEAGGRLTIGASSTHLGADSPWARVHHLNWRQRAAELMQNEESGKLHYTSPMTLSQKDAERLREEIIKFLESIDKIIEPSPSEELHCLNIDWFKI